MDNMCMWEILVPTVSNAGKPYRTRFHKVWDENVRLITNGLTVLKPVKGQWINETGTLFEERMIPVRVAATKEQMDEIAKMTIKFYEQEAVMFYKVSDEVHFAYPKYF